MNTEFDIENLTGYLSRRYKPSTVNAYLCEIRLFVETIGYDQCRHVRFKDITDYVGHLRAQNQKPNYISRQLSGIKAFFNWMVRTGERLDNPAQSLILADRYHAPIQFQNLLNVEELNILLSRRKYFKCIQYRNQAMMSLLVLQGITAGEATHLKIQDIDLEKGTVFLEATTYTISRILSLEASQILPLDYYMRYERPGLLKGKPQTDALFISRRGTPEDIQSFLLLIKTFIPLIPGKSLTSTVIRQSVLVSKFRAGWSMRKVQLFAGHRNMTTTERYKPQNMEALKNEIIQFHPLGNMAL